MDIDPPVSKRIATTTSWARRLSSGPWHILSGRAWGATACGRKLTGELERTRATADGPERDRERTGSHVCPACIRWANEPKGATPTGTTMWEAPGSGRLHTQQWCSSGSGRRMRQVFVPDQELATLQWGRDLRLCRCAISARDKAKARLGLDNPAAGLPSAYGATGAGTYGT